MDKRWNIYYGDIHNHNEIGYGKGSLERAIDIARSHLDFFAFTGHSSWHDLKPMEGGREAHWHKGFERFSAQWDKVQRLTAEANRDGEFATLLGFEWHSSWFGDQCVLFPDDYRPWVAPDNIEDLRAFCAEHGALMIPHHLAYPQGNRGVNWDVFTEDRTPVVEIHSEHGNSEHDRGPFEYFSHSNGGRVTAGTIRYALARGLRFGVYASTDSHSGFPAGYGEGVAAVLAERLDRASVFDALQARRTYGLTGDRIEVLFEVNGAPMGADVRADGTVKASYSVQARDELDSVELIQDGRIVHRAFPREEEWSEGDPVQIRLEWGWGPWGDLALDRVTDWRFRLEAEAGTFGRLFPCWRSGPFDEARRHRCRRLNDNVVEIDSYSARQGAYRQNPNHSLVFEYNGAPDSRIRIVLENPERGEDETTLAQLMTGGRFFPTGPFPKESMLWHRPVTRGFSTVEGVAELTASRNQPSNVYLRARQANGQIAWSSPVFLNHG